MHAASACVKSWVRKVVMMDKHAERIWYASLMPTVYESPDVPDYQKDSVAEYVRADIHAKLEIEFAKQANFEAITIAQDVLIKTQEALIAVQAKRMRELEELVRDCMEDESEFDTPWDKKARRLLGLSEAPEDG